MTKCFFAVGAILAVFMLVMTGCATQEYVQNQIAALDNDIARVQKQTETNSAEISGLKMSNQKQNRLVEEHSKRLQMAMARAVEAGKLAQGKLLYEATISDDSVLFAFDKSDLSDEAKRAIDVFAGVVKTQNKNVYIEIQGHTDDRGSEEHNSTLGQARAEKTLRYLHTKHGIPLHRMNAFSYGETSPIAANDSRANRAKNRRVTLVVME